MITSTEALDIADVPARLIVVGGGVIGLEFACIYEALGSQVTILEMMPTLLPGAADEGIAQRLALLLRRRGMSIVTGATVEEIASAGDGLAVTHRDAKGALTRIEGDRVLVATGRWPNTEGLGLAEVGVRMNGRAIAVDEHLATSVPNVWAVGDAIGGLMLAHKAMVDGRVAAENACGGSRTVDYRSVPNVVFTRPEVASVGLTEAQARQQGADVKVAQFPFSANPRAQILGETDGLVKLVCDAASGVVLGVHLMGPHATDLIAEGRPGRPARGNRRRPGLDDARPSNVAGGHARSSTRLPRRHHPLPEAVEAMPDYLETTVDKFIFRVATDRLYSPEGVWALAEGDRVRVGMTDFLQQRNGDVAFAEVRRQGTAVAAGDEVATDRDDQGQRGGDLPRQRHDRRR